MFIYLFKNENNITKETMEKLIKKANILRVIAHPVRLQILQTLGELGSLSVSDINKQIHSDIEQSMLSHHLVKMKTNGVLYSQKKGKYNYYSLVDKNLISVIDRI